MASEIDYSDKAIKQLGKMDKAASRRIMDYMDERVAPLDDPRSTGHALTGPLLGHLWTYRTGGYRAVCEIQDAAMKVLVVEVEDRKNVYRNMQH